MEHARKDSWKTEPMPKAISVLKYSEEFSPEEFDRISIGLIPKQMEDKWFVYVEGTKLRIHRSWTGHCIYEVEFEKRRDKYIVRRALVNRDQNEYRATDDAYDTKLVSFLINRLLLNREVEFPVPAVVAEKTPPGIFQHHVSGTASRERPIKPWWKVW